MPDQYTASRLPAIRVCERCRQRFQPIKEVVKRPRKFCSRSCASQTQAERTRLRPVTCAFCGVDFTPASSKIRFCSKSCVMRASYGTLAERLWRQVDKTDACWIGIGRNGKHWKLRREGSAKKVFAHRAAWEIADGSSIPPNMVVAHTCDVGACVRNDERGIYIVDGVTYPRWGHLFLCPEIANHIDKVEKGRQSRGASHGEAVRRQKASHPSHILRGEAVRKAKLTASLVQAIRTEYANGARQVDIAARYGVHQATISSIVRRETWAHLP